MAGLPKSLIKKYGITKKAWRIFRGRKAKKRTSKTRRSSKPKKRRRYVTRPRKKRRSGGGRNLAGTAMKWIRITALVAPAIHSAIGGGTPEQKLNEAMRKYTGFNAADGSFDWTWLSKGWGPYLGAVLATYGIPKLAAIIRRL